MVKRDLAASSERRKKLSHAPSSKGLWGYKRVEETYRLMNISWNSPVIAQFLFHHRGEFANRCHDDAYRANLHRIQEGSIFRTPDVLLSNMFRSSRWCCAATIVCPICLIISTEILNKLINQSHDFSVLSLTKRSLERIANDGAKLFLIL